MNVKEIVLKFCDLFPKSLKNSVFRLFAKVADKSVTLSTGYNSMEIALQNLKKLGYSPKSIIDIGAFKGEWTKEISQIFSESLFLMIEPQSSNAPLLRSLVNNKIFFERALLGSEVKENVPFYEMGTGSSYYEENTNHNRTVNLLSMNTLDNIIEKYNFGDEIFIKLDTQGSELDILKGASKTLENVHFILLEISVLNYNKNAPVFSDVVLFMEQIGFILWDIVAVHRKEGTHTLMQTDVIFTRCDSLIRTKENFKPNL